MISILEVKLKTVCCINESGKEQKSQNPENKRNGRIATVDITKGIGFFLVVLGHLVSTNSKTSLVIFAFHMPLFYMMAGYLMPMKVTRKRFLKKMLSLIFNYVMFSIIGLGLSLILPSWRTGLSFQSLVYDIIYNTQPECIHVGQIWFLFSMVWVTFLFFGIHFIIQKHEWLCFVVSLAIGSISVLSSLFNIRILAWGGIYGIPFKLLSGMSALVFVELGYISKKYHIIKKIDSVNSAYKLLLATLMIVGVVTLAERNVRVNIALGIYGSIPIYYFTSIGGTAGILLLSSSLKGKIADAIGYYGKNSLVFFCIHSLFLYGYAKVLSLIFKSNISIMQNISIPLSVVGTIIVVLCIIPIRYLYGISVGWAFENITECMLRNID